MAEVIGIVASAITIGASAAQISLALFTVAQTIKHAPKQIAEIAIAEELTLVSESLQTLADVISINQNFCKPALFKNTHTIILRYKQVDAEIKKLIDTPQKLAGLQWLINKPKAKGLLKKVEGIKTALILELNILRLAREEFTRPHSNVGPSTSVGLPPRFNRFRKVVESAVQANRKVVENAQEDEEDSGTGTRRYTNAELDIWKRGSFDTATWLYHLVFSPDVPSPPEANAKSRRLHQASVADGSTSSDEEVTLVRPEAEADADEKAMIVWNKQTEPSLVVDRLLSSWTTLSSDQIARSAANQDGDEWREDLLKNIEEAKKEELSFDEWELQNEPDDEDFKSSVRGSMNTTKTDERDSMSTITMPTYNFHSHAKNHRNRHEWRDDEWPYNTGSSVPVDAISDGPTYGSGTSRQSAAKRPLHERHVRWESDESSDEGSSSRPSRYERQSGYTRPFYSETESTSSKAHPTRSGQTASSTSTPGRNFPNPFDPNPASSSNNFGYPLSWQEPLQGTQFPTFEQRPSNPFSNSAHAWPNWSSALPPHFASVPPPSAPVPPPPMAAPYVQSPVMDSTLPGPRPPHAPAEEQSNQTEIAAKEKAIITAIEDLLKKRGQNEQLDASEPHFLKLMELFNTQQEREVQNERERANAATEAQTKLLQAMHDKDNERLKQLETLVQKLRDEETTLRRLWQEETENRVQEARDMAAKEIAAVQSAREEAEKQTQQRADAKAATELRNLKRNHKKELERYETLLREYQRQQAKSEQDAQQLVRRTRIAEGNRSVDVTEYSADKRNPFLTSSSYLRGLQQGFAQLGITRQQPYGQRQYPRHSRHDSFHGSTTSLQSSYASIGTENISKTNGTPQQLIIFPEKADRESQKITKLQTSLASLGIDSVFEDSDYGSGSQLMPYDHDDAGGHLVRSTIFWEAPMLTIGSELLLTMRQAGWRPAYARVSENGQTHFLGNQPIHTYFFSPDYKPQFSQSIDSPADDFIVIPKSIVHKSALKELGLGYKTTTTGDYLLDGDLTYNDIESLVERSFHMNEIRIRRLYRKFQRHLDKLSVSSTASTCSEDESSMSYNYDTDDRESSAASTVGRDVHSDHSDHTSTPSKGESTVKTPSIVSWASKSTKNPFRQGMLEAGETKRIAKQESNIWDDPVVASLI